jgi:PAS domain S-box-containing protein
MEFQIEAEHRKYAGSSPQNGSAPHIVGWGEMADRTRAFDWDRSPLGPVATWPESLLTAVNLMLVCPQPMFLWWGPELIQFYNDAYRAILRGDKHPKALGQRGRECWPEIWPIVGSQIEAVMRDATPSFQRNALVPIHRSGKLEDVYWTYSYSAVFDGAGNIRGTLVVCNETTEEVVAEQRLRKSENRFRRLIEEANVGVVIGDLKGNLSYLNPATLKLLGYTRQEVESGRVRWNELTPPEFADRDRKATEELMKFGKAEPYEKAYISKNGRKIPLLVGSTLLADVEGHEPEVAVFLADLTALRRAEGALLRNEKLAAVGRLASSIAHEINNPLEAVTNLLYLVENETHSRDALQFIKTAQSELNRVANITRHTLRFHRQLTKPVMTTKAEILNEVLTLFRGRLAAVGLRLETRFSAVKPTLCYGGDLRQLFANFISNAVDASSRGGRICLRERQGTDWRTNRPGIRVTIADTGCGMSKETIRRIFEPFFTTKETTGTGLGLWVSAGILEKHGARISIHSSQGARKHGTVFAIWFPIEGVAETNGEDKDASMVEISSPN